MTFKVFMVCHHTPMNQKFGVLQKVLYHLSCSHDLCCSY